MNEEIVYHTYINISTKMDVHMPVPNILIEKHLTEKLEHILIAEFKKLLVFMLTNN